MQVVRARESRDETFRRTHPRMRIDCDLSRSNDAVIFHRVSSSFCEFDVFEFGADVIARERGWVFGLHFLVGAIGGFSNLFIACRRDGHVSNAANELVVIGVVNARLGV